MFIILIVFFLLPLSGLSQVNYDFITEPAKNPNKDKIVVEAADGETIKIYCKVIALNMTQVRTNWMIVNSDGLDEQLSYIGGVAVGYPFLSIADDLIYEANLTISFTNDTDRIQLKCQGGTTKITFIIGIPAAPILEEPTNIFNITENTASLVNLTAAENNPFPPYITSVWTVDGHLITDNNITTTDYVITFNFVTRSQSGLYMLNVSNDAGSAKASFTLNVQYQPGGDPGDSVVYALPGETVTLTALRNFVSNPPPHIRAWTDNNENIVSLEGRFQDVFTDVVQLIITNVTYDDNGTWVFGAINVIGDVSMEVMLKIAVPPGAPTGLTNVSVTDTDATLSWTTPSVIGDPPLTHYKINIKPPPTSDVVLITNSTSITLRGLIPGTEYNITVVGVSTLYPDGGEPSEWRLAITNTGPPKFETANAESTDGAIVFKWTLHHTGGLDREMVEIIAQCRRHNEPRHSGISSGSGNGMTYVKSIVSCIGNTNTCLNTTLMGAATIGPIHAGEIHDCVVQVITDEGSDIKEFPGIIPDTGIPSAPIIAIESYPGNFVLIVRSSHAGVPSDDITFKFRIVIRDNQSQVVYNKTYSYPRYLNNQHVTVNLSLELPKGTYDINVTAINKYGSSEPSNLVTVLFPRDMSTSSPTPTTSSPTTTSSSCVACIAGGVSGSVIVIVIVIVIAVIIALIIIKKKKGSLKITPEKLKLCIV